MIANPTSMGLFNPSGLLANPNANINVFGLRENYWFVDLQVNKWKGCFPESVLGFIRQIKMIDKKTVKNSKNFFIFFLIHFQTDTKKLYTIRDKEGISVYMYYRGQLRIMNHEASLSKYFIFRFELFWHDIGNIGKYIV